MNYALIENGIVTNLIWMYPDNTDTFPNAIPINDILVHIGDTYTEGVFYRQGERVLTNLEYLQIGYEATIAELDTALLDATYENLNNKF